MQVVFEKGELLEYIAQRDFGLNFEDRSIKSVKVKKGESVLYDGEIAHYKMSNGAEVVGKCPSLRSAINVMNWLVLKNGQKKDFPEEVKIETSKAVILPSPGDYDGFRGGSFDSYAVKNRDGVYVAPIPPKMSVVKEKQRIAKETHDLTKPQNTPKMPVETLDTSRDQVEVKKGFIVSSSTAVNKETKREMPLVRRDEMASEGVLPIEGVKEASSKGSKKAPLIIDDKTPVTISEDMTKEEVDKMKAIPAEESQQGTIVRKVGSTMIVQEVDGITMKKKNVEGITFTSNPSTNKEIVFTAKVSSGSDHISTAQDEGTVVGKVTSIEKRDANAAAKAAERKLASKNTQMMMEQARASVQAAKPESPKTETGQKTADLMALLPADWGKLHWTKKEAFIMACNNKDLILFIQDMETSKAVLNACSVRLMQLEAKT